ncbi:MAG TPA: tripartite tricarboxylate transporter substrate binding protein [Burkholderiales bacterium]|nr:tripartite tricarboxylate transporter substrate binding protein [Burkholderiales bacterium]
MRSLRALLHLAALAALSAALQHAQAQNYPTRPVRLIVGFAPGGPTDILARVIAPRFSETLGQPVVVDNKPGASGNIGAELVARSTPDGHTLLFGDVTFIVNPSLFKSVPFNPQTDFLPVGFAGSTPQVLVVPSSLDPKDVAEFVKWTKSRPGQLSYGSAGSGSPPHLAGELFKLAHGLDMQVVHYKGTGMAFPDLVSGRLQMMIISATASKPYIDSGKVRALAISGTKRFPGLRSVPTFAEAGVPLPDLDFGAWWGLFAPGGIPREIVAKLNQDLNRALAQPDMQERLTTNQIETVAMTPEAFGNFVRDETSKWARVIQRAKIVAD